MKTTVTHRRSGIALMVVMIAVAVLSFLAAGFAIMMKVETKLAQNAGSEQELLWLGRSGMEYARYILAQQVNIANQPYDSLNQIWAGGPGDGSNILSTLSLKDYPLGNGFFTVTIVDLERKVNINIVDDEVLEQAFRLVGIDAGEAPMIASSILDWVDPNDDPRLNGTESSYYQGLNPPYFAKNAPIDDLSELLLIRGVTPEMYWGSNATNHPPAFFQGDMGRANFQENYYDYACGLVDIFTPISTGKVNINTASLIVLQMIPGVDENIAQCIIDTRNGADDVDGTEDDKPFENFGEVINCGVANQDISRMSRYGDVRSHAFQVTVDARVGGYERQFVAILGRNSATDVQVLSFYWK